MKSLLKLTLSLWLVALVALPGFASAMSTSGMTALALAYDERAQPTIPYDTPSLSASGYDAAPAPVANETGNPRWGTAHVFAKFAEFLAAKGGGQTFEILDGVRRAKAADLVGNPTIPAQILNAEGKVVGTQNIPISQLLSPKSSIDVSTSVNMDRFMNTLNQTKAGSVPPPITVTPGVNGTPIPRVPLDPLGPH